MAERDTPRNMEQSGFPHPLYPDLHGTVGIDSDNNQIIEWRNAQNAVIYTTELMGLVDILEESCREKGINPYENPLTGAILRNLTHAIEEIETEDEIGHVRHAPHSPEME